MFKNYYVNNCFADITKENELFFEASEGKMVVAFIEKIETDIVVDKGVVIVVDKTSSDEVEVDTILYVVSSKHIYNILMHLCCLELLDDEATSIFVMFGLNLPNR